MMRIKDYLRDLASVSSDIPEVIGRLKNCDREIILFPAGTVAKGFFRTLDQFGVRVSCFGDNNPQKAGTVLYEHPVLSFDDICADHSEAVIIISSRMLCSEITEQFLKEGFEKNSIVYRDFSSWNAHSGFRGDMMNDLERFDDVYRLLGDELSRQTFLAKLKYMHDFDPETLDGVMCREAMYFDNALIHLSEKEYFVDGGAFTGDTFMDFRRRVAAFGGYYAFEPEEDNFNALIENTKGISNVYAINKGLWSKETRLGIFSQGGGSSLIEDIDETHRFADAVVPVTSIDTVCADVPVTFIKMDIEGAEMKALQGARNTVKRCHPKLAICVYHKPMDIVDLPLYMHELMPDAKMHMRHYGIGGTDTVCYLIP